ncbi:hypothetical protein Tco_0070180, partial [Tanacetum coccineum]
IVPAFLKEPICKVHKLLVSLLELSRFEILLDELGVGQCPFSSQAWQVTDTGCRFLPVSGPLFLQFLGKASSIPTVFS